MLYTIYADGSYQYYELNHCYRCFFPFTLNENNKTGIVQTYTIYHYQNQTTKENYFYEIQYYGIDCSNEARLIRIQVGKNCSTCDYNLTTDETIGNTFASMIFTPTEQGTCDKSNRYVRNYYPNVIHDKCVNGIVKTNVNGNIVGVKMAFWQKIYKEKNKDIFERKRYLGDSCQGDPQETLIAECNTCVKVNCEITAYAQIGCKSISSASPLYILFIPFIYILLL